MHFRYRLHKILQKSDWVRCDSQKLKNEKIVTANRQKVSTRLEEEDGDLTKVEVDEVLGLVGNVGTEVSAHDAMPGGVVLLVELLLDESGDVFLNVELLQRLRRNVDSVLLHVLGHVCVFDNCLAISHDNLNY